MSALDDLIAAVEAGKFPSHSSLGILRPSEEVLVIAAYNDNLGATKELHKALLPDDYILQSDSTGFARIWRDEFEVTHNWSALVPGNEGCARLLVILKAIRAQQ